MPYDKRKIRTARGTEKKLRLFEGLYPEPEKTPGEMLWEIEALIEEKWRNTENR